MRSKTHEPVLFERSEFTGECAEQLIESRKLSAAARRCRGYRGIPPVLLFFCRRFLFQIKRKCRNAGNIKSLTMVGRECRVQILRVHIVPLSRQRVVGVADPYKIRGNKIVRGSRANDICPYRIPFHYSLLPITLSKAKQTPQSRLCRASSPAGEPKSRRSLFCLPLNKIYAILNSALRRDSPCGCPLSAPSI